MSVLSEDEIEIQVVEMVVWRQTMVGDWIAIDGRNGFVRAVQELCVSGPNMWEMRTKFQIKIYNKELDEFQS